MTKQGKIPDINKKLLEMDGGEVAEGSPDIELAGNEVAADDLANGMGENGRGHDKSFFVQEDGPQVH